MKKKDLKAKLALQKQISEALSRTVQEYHLRVDSMYAQIIKIKATAFDLLAER
jgi:uncharacterized coiled-coil protein SlyX